MLGEGEPYIQYDQCLYKKRSRQKDTTTPRECHGGRDSDRRDVSTSLGTPRTADKSQKLRRGKEGFFPKAVRESMSLLTSCFVLFFF